jgi:hypothetical protein
MKAINSKYPRNPMPYKHKENHIKMYYIKLLKPIDGEKNSKCKQQK